MKIPPHSQKGSKITGATYQIAVMGIIDEDWFDRMAGMDIYHHQTENGPISTLIGEIIDQSELFGILSTLNDYGYKIISVNKINHKF